MKNKIKSILSLVIISVVIYFFYKTLSKNWKELDFSAYQINLFYTILAIILLVLFYLFSTSNWRFIISRLGNNINYKKCLKIKTLSDLGRYIPGKAWYVVGRTYFSKKQGVSNKKTITSIIIEHLFLLAIAFALFVLFNLKKVIQLQISQALLNTLVIIGISILIFLPKLLNILVGVGMKIKNINDKETLKIEIRIIDSLQLVLRYILLWIMVGASFVFTIKSIYPAFNMNNLFFFTGIFAISWCIGLLSFITPGGLGVREGIMTTLLAPYMPLSIAIAAPILLRIYSILTEATLSLFVLKIRD